MTVVGPLTGWLFTPGMARDLAAIRILVGTYGAVWLLISFDELSGLGDLDHGRFRPVGVVGLAGIGPVPTWLIVAAWAATVVAACCTAAGFGHRVAGPTFAVGLLFLTTYQNSWGKLLHTENLLVIHALVLAASPAADALARRRTASVVSGRYGWPIRAMALATVLSYLAAGIAKLRHGGLSWMTADNLGNWITFDLTRKELFGDPYLSVTARILDYGWLLAIAAIVTVVIEVSAPLALVFRRVTIPWAMAAWVLHAMVLVMMAVAFPYHLVGIALLPVVLAARDGATPTEPSGNRGRSRYRGSAPRPVGGGWRASE